MAGKDIFRNPIDANHILKGLSTDELRNLAKKDERTTSHGSAAYISVVRNRSAKFTEVIFGDPTPEQRTVIEQMTHLAAVAIERMTLASDIDKARFYKTADIFCAPSTGQESFGIVLLEAMAAGCAIVASDIHGYKKVVQRNVSALLVEPREVDALARALERLVGDPELRQRIGRAGAERAPEYDWSHVTAQLVGVYEEVIAARSMR